MASKTQWFADVLEYIEGEVPKNHRFNLGEFLFADQAKFCLMQMLKEMPHKFIIQSIRFSYLIKQGGEEGWISIFPNKQS